MTKNTYQDQLPEGAVVVAWNEGWVVWKQAYIPFPNRPYAVHQTYGNGNLGDGTYDLDAAEASALTGLAL